MSEKSKGNFADIYSSPDTTVQAAIDAYDIASEETVRQSARRPGTGKSGPVEARRADPRVWAATQQILATQGGVYPDIQPDGSVIIRNNP